jgi:hypothetical protein
MKYVTSDAVQAIVAKADLTKPVFEVRMTRLHDAGFCRYKSSSDTPERVACRVVEGRYKVADGYKIEVEAEDPQYGRESFYLLDFAAFMRDGQVVALQ